MKKHRNFLAFYTLWIGGIFLAFMLFGTDRDQNRIPVDESKAICGFNENSMARAERHQCDERGGAR